MHGRPRAWYQTCPRVAKASCGASGALLGPMMSLRTSCPRSCPRSCSTSCQTSWKMSWTTWTRAAQASSSEVSFEPKLPHTCPAVADADAEPPDLGPLTEAAIVAEVRVVPDSVATRSRLDAAQAVRRRRNTQSDLVNGAEGATVERERRDWRGCSCRGRRRIGR